VELTTYATPNIIGEIKRHFRDKGWAVRVPRGLQELNVQLSRLVEQLTVQLERSPTISELAKASDSTEEEVLEALESGRAYSTLSLSTGGGGDGDDELERRILHLRFFEGLTQSQIAQQVGISQMHVSRLIRRSLEKIRAEIAEEEPAEPQRAAQG
jgi:RNA polymerase sigma-B factor